MTRNPPPLLQSAFPRHVAIIMDGNGRWAKARGKPRAFGHRSGVKSVRRVLRASHKLGIQALTLFAFSQENWRRPEIEVRLLMQLFTRALVRESASLHKNGVRIRFIGDHSRFPAPLRAKMHEAERLTGANTGVQLTIAAGYGGQWDIVRAARRLAKAGSEITEARLERELATAELPPVDLLIRTGGEKRISNFMLWQISYSEIYFCDPLWPDFDDAAFLTALNWFAGRERRFGTVAETA